MMKTLFYLESCSTCQRIMKNLVLPESVRLREIKSEPLTENELHALYERSGSYEALLSKRARLYQERELKNQSLDENDYKKLLLEHYTFLKRPVLVWGDQIAIGNSKKTEAQAYQLIHE